MSEQEFENWLSLLAGLLQLSPEQRKSISTELRSHLEERMEDLINAGSSREEAIAIALEEFGDTAALAHHFTSNAHLNRRRLMRYTYGTIAAVTCAILVLAAFWPGPQAPLTPQGIAQSESAAKGTIGTKQVAPKIQSQTSFADSRAKIEALLAEPWEAEFDGTSLHEVLDTLSEQKGIGILIDPRVSDEIDTGSPIFVHVGKNMLSGKTLLNEFILGPLELGYKIRDNSLLITTIEEIYSSTERYEIVVYNCRDLLAGMPGKPSIGSGRGFAGGPAPTYNAQAKPGTEAKDSSSVTDGGGIIAPSSGTQMAPPILVTGLAARERQLMKVIQTAIRNEDCPWDDGSSATDETVGSIEALNGLLVVRQTREMHEKVAQLLELLREATKQGAWPSDDGGWPNYEMFLPPAGGAGTKPAGTEVERVF